MIGVLNLGVGGSLVTPLAAAAAEGDEERQVVLVQAGLAPVIALCLTGMAVVIPAVALLPPKTLLGKASVGSALDLHAAILIAVTVALASIPLSSIDVLRQAFQELHISNLLGAASNVAVCLTLLVAAHYSTALMVFIAAFTLPPLAFKIGNWGCLFGQKRYLLRMPNRFPWRESQRLLGDGLRYVLASFSFVLVYQWPVYWIARTLPASESAPFAISMQIVLLSLSFTLGFLRPMWSSTADAHACGDHAWLERQIKKGRLTIVLAGVGVLAAMLLVGQPMVRIWIRQPITLGWQTRGLIGTLILLSIWEQFHFLLTLGLGQLREAAIAVFQSGRCLRSGRAAAHRARRTQGALVRYLLLHFVLDSLAAAKVAASTACSRWMSGVRTTRSRLALRRNRADCGLGNHGSECSMECTAKLCLASARDRLYC